MARPKEPTESPDKAGGNGDESGAGPDSLGAFRRFTRKLLDVAPEDVRRAETAIPKHKTNETNS